MATGEIATPRTLPEELPEGMLPPELLFDLTIEFESYALSERYFVHQFSI